MPTLTTEFDLDLFTKEGKPRKRRRKTDRNYFTQETEDAIIAFRDSTDPVFRDRIFSSSIDYPINKLVENIINTYKFDYAEMHAGGFEDLKHETVCKVVSEIPKYKQDLGKAYSYFGTIAKRYLIQYNDKQHKLLKNRQEIESQESTEKVDKIRHEGDADRDLQNFTQHFSNWVEEGIDDWFYIFEKIEGSEGEVREVAIKFTESEKMIVRSILKFFRTVDQLDVFLKPAFYLQIREDTKLKTQDVTKVVNILKESFHEQLYEYHHRGELCINHRDIFDKSEKEREEERKEDEDKIVDLFSLG